MPFDLSSGSTSPYDRLRWMPPSITSSTCSCHIRRFNVSAMFTSTYHQIEHTNRFVIWYDFAIWPFLSNVTIRSVVCWSQRSKRSHPFKKRFASVWRHCWLVYVWMSLTSSHPKAPPLKKISSKKRVSLQKCRSIFQSQFGPLPVRISTRELHHSIRLNV